MGSLTHKVPCTIVLAGKHQMVWLTSDKLCKKKKANPGSLVFIVIMPKLCSTQPWHPAADKEMGAWTPKWGMMEACCPAGRMLSYATGHSTALLRPSFHSSLVLTFWFLLHKRSKWGKSCGAKGRTQHLHSRSYLCVALLGLPEMEGADGIHCLVHRGHVVLALSSAQFCCPL